MGFDIVQKLLGIARLGSAWVLWLLLFLSVISVALIFERAAFFLRTRLDFRGFMDDLLQRLQKEDWQGLESLAKQSSAVESQIVLRGIAFREAGPHAMEQSMASYMATEKQNLDRGLVVLGTLGNNAPFIGLFGTVIGIIQAFHNLSNNPAGGPSVVMAGISEALIATAVGIGVAIPAVIAYNAFQRVVKARMSNAEAVKRIVTAHFTGVVD